MMGRLENSRLDFVLLIVADLFQFCPLFADCPPFCCCGGGGHLRAASLWFIGGHLRAASLWFIGGHLKASVVMILFFCLAG